MDPQQIDPNQLIAILQQRAWVPLASVVIFLTIRLFKADTKLPWTIPPRARIAVVIGLGLSSGVLEHVTQGQSWRNAITGTGISIVLALLFHEGIVESIRNGRDIVLPGLIIPGIPSSPNAPVTVPLVPRPPPPTMKSAASLPDLSLMQLPSDAPGPASETKLVIPTGDRPPNNVD